MALKERLTTTLILTYPDFSIPFTLHTEASGDGIRFNLTQVQHGWEWAIVYDGQNFSDTEEKYSATQWEALSVVAAIQKCRSYMLGNHFTVVVDHQALKWLMSLRDPTGRLARWALTQQGYDFTINTMGLNFCYLKSIHSSSTLSSKNNGTYSKESAKDYSSLLNWRDVMPINILRIIHPQLSFQSPRLLKMAQTSRHHADSRHRVY